MVYKSSVLLSSVLRSLSTEKFTLFVSSQSKSHQNNHNERKKKKIWVLFSSWFWRIFDQFFPRLVFDRERDGHESYPTLLALPALQFWPFSFWESNLVESPSVWNEMRIGGNPDQCRHLGRLHCHPRPWSLGCPEALCKGKPQYLIWVFLFSSHDFVNRMNLGFVLFVLCAFDLGFVSDWIELDLGGGVFNGL